MVNTLLVIRRVLMRMCCRLLHRLLSRQVSEIDQIAVHGAAGAAVQRHVEVCAVAARVDAVLAWGEVEFADGGHFGCVGFDSRDK